MIAFSVPLIPILNVVVAVVLSLALFSDLELLLRMQQGIIVGLSY